MNVDRVKFAAELARSGLKVYELANAAKVSRATVTAIKQGKNCYMETAIKLAEALGCQLSDIT